MKTFLELPVRVVFDYEPAEEPYLSGPPEACYPGHPDQVTILRVFVKGDDRDVLKLLTLEQITALESEVLEFIKEKQKSNLEDKAETKYKERNYRYE